MRIKVTDLQDFKTGCQEIIDFYAKHYNGKDGVKPLAFDNPYFPVCIALDNENTGLFFMISENMDHSQTLDMKYGTNELENASKEFKVAYNQLNTNPRKLTNVTVDNEFNFSNYQELTEKVPYVETSNLLGLICSYIYDMNKVIEAARQNCPISEVKIPTEIEEFTNQFILTHANKETYPKTNINDLIEEETYNKYRFVDKDSTNAKQYEQELLGKLRIANPNSYLLGKIRGNGKDCVIISSNTGGYRIEMKEKPEMGFSDRLVAIDKQGYEHNFANAYANILRRSKPYVFAKTEDDYIVKSCEKAVNKALKKEKIKTTYKNISTNNKPASLTHKK